MVDTGRGGIGKQRKAWSRRKGEDNNCFVDEDGLQKHGKRCERCSWQKGWKQGSTRSTQWDFYLERI